MNAELYGAPIIEGRRGHRRGRHNRRRGDGGADAGDASPVAGTASPHRGRGGGRGRGRGGGRGRGRGGRGGGRLDRSDAYRQEADEQGRRGRRHWEKNTQRQNHPGGGVRLRQLTPDEIKRFASLEPSKLVKQMKDLLKEFQSALNAKRGPMDDVLTILSKLVELASQRESNEQSNASIIIAEILSERSGEFHLHLVKYVSQGENFTDRNVNMLCNLFLSMLKKFQTLACTCLPIDELTQTVDRKRKSGSLSEAMSKKVEMLCNTRDEIRITSNEPKRLDVVDGEERDDSSFRQIPILPDWNEIREDKGTPLEVRPNKVETPYKDWMEYYDIQFCLIREDFIAPLRRGVAAFLQGDRGKKNRDVKTYSGAQIVSQVTTKEKGICFTIQFDASGFRKVNYNWDQSKRLIFGSLLCFIPVGHGTADDIIFGTVADRDSNSLRRGSLMVQFEGDVLEAMTHCKNHTEFEIVESNSYFGATSPILRSIQKAEVETMPFSEQLIEGKCESVPPPTYLTSNQISVVYNLSCLYGPLKKRKNKPPLMIEILNQDSWEAARNSELDSSQLHAIQIALTQEISVIQGPPGTGKTYIGLKIVEGLLENRRIWDPRRSRPIFVMCFTNHALDQFLEGIIDTECCGRKLQVIRVGGRCKNEKVEAFNLNKVRRSGPRRNRQFTVEISQLRDEIKECNPEKAWHNVNSFYRRKGFMPLYILKHFVHPYHFYQLTQMPKCEEQRGNEVEVWLGLWEGKLEKWKKRHKKKKTTEQPAPVLKQEQDNPNRNKPPEGKQEKEHVQTKGGAKAENETEAQEEEEEELVEVKGEATLVQEDRMDQDDVEGFQRVELPEEVVPKEEIVTVIEKTEESDDQESDEEDEKEDEKDDAANHKKEDAAEAQDNENLVTKWYRRNDADKIIRNNMFKEDLIMDSDEVEELCHSNTGIESLTTKDRWRLYNYWAEQRFKFLQEENRKKCQEYSEKCRQLAELRQQEDRHILEAADVIGMTTTGAAKYQHILQNIKPKIVIVEEAAEVLEAHIVSALSAGTQHLILIGDHKQLRPKPNEHVLATKYNLSTSLFERLVKRGMSRATLEIQHRMRPEIAGLVCPHIYDKLLNHESVEKYPDVQGISKNLFFISHTEPESENPSILSYQNEFEAKYIVALCAHLFKLGYKPTQITILTPYVGQLLMLRNKMPKSKFEGVHVTAIDNFQGEENDIILFSMVRSGKSTIGFVKEDNRVCVSLSRAKHGFYAIGNFELIRTHSFLWESIIKDVDQRKCYGPALPLYCCNHPETQFLAKKDTDFEEHAPNGGCKKMCDIRLPCGHACTQLCHVTDTEHAKFKCVKPCDRSCPYGHPCTSGHYCYKKCKPCRKVVSRVMPICEHLQEMECRVDVEEHQCIQQVSKIMPLCGHEQVMECSTRPSAVLCQAPCSRKCPSGHPCQKACYQDCNPCPVEVEKVIPGCNHKQMVPCGVLADFFTCQATCSKPCSNGLHLCKKKCYKECGDCKVMVEKKLPVCGHHQTVECYREPDPSQCKDLCIKKCPNGLHTMQKMCRDDWPRCTEKITRKLPQCGHEKYVQCFEDLSTVLCLRPCERLCSAGHKCLKLCHEQCPPCPEKVVKKLPCGHTHVISCFETKSYKCPMKCLKSCKKGHRCQELCHFPLPCKPCTEVVAVTMPVCLHKQNIKCFESSQPLKSCKHPCERKLACGHVCQNKCGETCQTVCTTNVKSRLACGHYAIMKCQSETRPLCKESITIKIDCGHTIQTKCYKQILRNLLKKECTGKCTKFLGCGHRCQDLCNKPCTEQCTVMVKKRRSCGHEIVTECFFSSAIDDSPCTEKCRRKLSCGHACKNKCGEPCSTCNLKSKVKYPCGHSARIPCDSTIENHPCTKKCGVTLSCGHCCTGKCGDCYSRRMHAVCIFEIELRRFCGHSETVPCAGLSDSCDKPHTVPCAHGNDSTQCHEICSWNCEHHECDEACSEECGRPPCKKHCDRALRCGHTCPGLCGERCISYCHQCNTKKFMEMYHPKPKKGRVPQNPPFFELECGHIFTVSYLDDLIHNPDRPVTPKQCPKCHQNIAVGSRYGSSVRRALTDVAIISNHIEAEGLNIPEYNLLSKCNTLAKELINNLRLFQSFPDILSLTHQVRNLQIYFEHSATSEPQPERRVSSVRELLDAQIVPKKKQSKQLYLTYQLLDDFISELYRFSLRAQCLIVHSQSPSSLLSPLRKTGSRETIISRVEKYLENLHPLEDRISEEFYLEFSKQIKLLAPGAASLHVVTPDIPAPVKGTWGKCRKGHYFCIPPKCGGNDSKLFKCPVCL